VRDVWWSDDQALPSEFVMAEAAGPVHFSVVEMRMDADEQLLRTPTVRFPDYRSIEIADWLEFH
jgi:hypothetical protein